MKVGDLVVYNLGPYMPGEEAYKDVAVVTACLNPLRSCGSVRKFRFYYPHYNNFLIGWEDAYRVIS
jgi:hypothetical protein